MGAVYGGVKKIGFLSDRELELALAAGNASGAAMRAFGGYESAERCVLAFSDCEENLCDEVFEIGCVRIEAGAEAKRLTHRDYLGALMVLFYFWASPVRRWAIFCPMRKGPLSMRAAWLCSVF